MNTAGKPSKSIFHIKESIVMLLTAVALIFFSTACDRTTKDGDWDDNIHLSVKTVNFNANADSVVVTTKGTWWWVSSVSVNGNYFNPTEDIDLESDHYTFAKDCFVVERKDSKTLFIKAAANTTGSIRTIGVQLEAGDYFDAVTVTQAAR